VNSMPLLSSYNCFTCLKVDTLIEPHRCIAKAMQTYSHPLIPNQCSHHLAWEHQLSVTYVLAASPGLMSLLVNVEIEFTDTAVK
jgi:hypothetical protein